MSERRVFNKIPESLQTELNDRETGLIDDMLFEPENADFHNGYIGSTDALTVEDLERSPIVTHSRNPDDHLVIAASLVDETGARSGGAFVSDVYSMLETNGSQADKRGEMFSTPYYAWSAPVDYDMHINFSQYHWLGSDTPDFVVMERRGIDCKLHQIVSGVVVVHAVTSSATAPTAPSVGDIWEDASAATRLMYRWDGSVWSLVVFKVASDTPVPADYSDLDYVYVTRTGQDFSRYTIGITGTRHGQVYRDVVVSNDTPDAPVEGMIWESIAAPVRTLMIYQNGSFVPLVWSTDETDEYTYDVAGSNNEWQAQNKWFNYYDLSPSDRAKLTSSTQATRPILNFHADMEMETQTKTSLNQSPLFKAYTIDITTRSLVYNGSATVMAYKQGASGVNDAVLGFPLSYNSSGEFEFGFDLDQTDVGYRYFKNVLTNKFQGMWTKSPTELAPELSGDTWSTPASFTTNTTHANPDTMSRSRLLDHMGAVMAAQADFSGTVTGANSYRWTDQNPVDGAMIIDAENTLTRIFATMQKDGTDIPSTIRRMKREYIKVVSRFEQQMNNAWDTLLVNDPAGTPYGTADEVLDVILTRLFIGRNDTFPFANSGMGTFTQRQASGTTLGVIGGSLPIFIPASPPRIGATPAFKPTKVTRDGVTRLRGHDGSMRDSFGDFRDDVWLAFHQKFYDQIPTEYRDETLASSVRYSGSAFALDEFVGGWENRTETAVDRVVDDYTTASMAVGEKVFSQQHGEVVEYTGGRYIETYAPVNHVFRTPTELHFYNGQSCFVMNGVYETAHDYSIRDFRDIIQRDVENYVNDRSLDLGENGSYSAADPFTWNYASAGIEGHYKGIYQRLYGTPEPHLEPWVIAGYADQPEWWDIAFPIFTTDADGNTLRGSGNPMWIALQAGEVNPINGFVRADKAMTAPIPVDTDGNLLNPIELGIVSSENLIQVELSENWMYEDFGPVEQQYYESVEYVFSKAMAGFLMKPALMVERTWAELIVDIDGDIADGPHSVHSQKLFRPSQSLEYVDGETQNGALVVQPGLNAWIGEYAKGLGLGANVLGEALRQTTMGLAWKTNGFINAERAVISTLGGIRVPYEDRQVSLYGATPSTGLFGSALTFVRDDSGYRVYGYDTINREFRVDSPVTLNGGGGVEIREALTTVAGVNTFTTSVTLPVNDTATLSVFRNGVVVASKFYQIADENTLVIDPVVAVVETDNYSIVVQTTEGNQRGFRKSFTYDGIQYSYSDHPSGILKIVPYGTYFDTPEEVIDFITGYQRQMLNDGWDIDTGLVLVEGFVAWARTSNDGDEVSLTPFGESAVHDAEFGFMRDPDTLNAGTYNILDVNGDPIHPDDVQVFRKGGNSKYTSSANPIYGVRLLSTYVEHVVFFSNTTKFSDIIYDPITGQTQATLSVDVYRAGNWNGRMDAPGFMVENTIIPNFEKQTKDITRYLNRHNPIDDPLKRAQGRELYGWYPNASAVAADGTTTPMMDALETDERTGYNYHLGMIHAKGTKRANEAFVRGSRLGNDNVNAFETWAWRAHVYGDTRREVARFESESGYFLRRLQTVNFGAPMDRLDVLNIPAVTDEAWGIQPGMRQTTDSRFHFLKKNGSIDRNVKTFMKVYDRDDKSEVARMYQHDPANGVFSPTALGYIDARSKYDPARYSETGAHSDTTVWNAARVGSIWWDTSSLVYNDYHAITDITERERMWGTLKETTGAVTIVGDKTTYVCDVAHDKDVGDRVVISGISESVFNGTFVITEVTNDTTFVITTPSRTITTVSGTPKIRLGQIDIYEWVESPVTPDGYARYIDSLPDNGSPNGVPVNGDSTEYTTAMVTLANGQNAQRYYFWVRENSGENPIKDVTAATIANYLENPEATGHGWFGLVSEDMAIFNIGSAPKGIGHGIEIKQVDATTDQHAEWVLIDEGDDVETIPDIAMSRLRASLSGVDAFGTSVPAAALVNDERYGPSEFPPQTIFKDRTKALTRFVSIVNTVYASVDLADRVSVGTHFSLSNEGTVFNRVTYRDEGITETPFDTVLDTVVLNRRDAEKRYTTGDVVVVQTTNLTSPWGDTSVDEWFQKQSDGTFTRVGAENRTIELLDHTSATAATIQATFDAVVAMATPEELNKIFFDMMYEMHEQIEEADWFVKTSYVSLHVQSQFNEGSFVRPNETEAIIANYLEVKPYRTKLRKATLSFKKEIPEDVALSVEDDHFIKITEKFDDLRCPGQDFGWDVHDWDYPHSWDYNPLAADNLGQQDYVESGRMVAPGDQATFTVSTSANPTMYNYEVVILDPGGNTVNVSDYGITMTHSPTQTGVVITLGQVLTGGYTFIINVARGLYNGAEPTLGTDLTELGFLPTEDSYMDAWTRAYQNGTTPDVPNTCGVNRVATEVRGSGGIYVTTNWTPAYAAWDASTWDGTGWNSPPVDNGSRSFMVPFAHDITIDPGFAFYYTSTQGVVGENLIVTKPHDRDVVAFRWRGETVPSEAIDEVDGYYQFKHDREVIIDVAAGQTDITIDYYFDRPEMVFLGMTQLTEGVHYDVTDTGITVINPPDTKTDAYAFFDTVVVGGDNGDTYAVLPTSSENTALYDHWAFVGGKRIGITVGTNSNYVLDTIVPIGEFFTIASIGGPRVSGPHSDTTSIIATAGLTTVPVTGNADSENTWVFVDGAYQHLGVDYVINGTDVEFTNPLVIGQNVQIDVLKDDLDTIGWMPHMNISASGTASDTIPTVIPVGLENRMQVFVNGVHQVQGANYEISSNQINWYTVPTLADRITIRGFQRFTRDEITTTATTIAVADQIRVRLKTVVAVGDEIEMEFNNFDLDRSGGPLVALAPGSYQWTDTKMVLDTPVVGGVIMLKYTKPTTVYGDSTVLPYRAEHAHLDVETFVTTEVDNPVDGLRVLETDTGDIHEYTLGVWGVANTVVANAAVYISSRDYIVRYDAPGVTELSHVSDEDIANGVHAFPKYGAGVTFGTLALGQHATAAVNYPVAFAIVGSPGAF